MRTRQASWLAGVVVLACGASNAAAQTRPASSQAPAIPVEQAVELAARGQCPQALPVLKRSLGHVAEKDLKYRSAMAAAKCAMSLDQRETAVQAILVLDRDFPNEPEVLYISTHYFSELANRSAQQLAAAAPGSYQARELEAEAFESQEKWDEAAGMYRKILEENPTLPGIHFRLGRIALDKGATAENTEQARQEFEAELKNDPTNAASEFSIGEIERRAGHWDAALARFEKASELDAGFAEAYLAVGITLSSQEKFSQAVAPLERYVKLVPGDPAGHYQLGIAYARSGRKADSDREMNIHRQIAARMQASRPAPSGTPRQ